jgi:phosphoglycerate dehydrogenase-like enzyme
MEGYLRSKPCVALVPKWDEAMIAAIVEGGGEPCEPEQAQAIVWTDPHDPEGLRKVLEASPATWVQLPLAGIEAFVAIGIIDSERIWTSAKGIYGYACAEHAVALMLAAARRIHRHVLIRKWETAPVGSPHRLLRGSTVVIVGTGGIGRALIPLLHPFGVRILGASRAASPLPGVERMVAPEHLVDIVPEADFVVLAAPLTPRTRHLFDRAMLAHMKTTAWLVNVARGGLIDTDALVEALRAGTIGGAALDVTDPEPLPEDHPLWEMEEAIVTCHVANTLDMSLPQLRALVRRNVRRFVSGEPLEGLIDPDQGY